MSLIKPWKAVIFDLDDTLYRELDYVTAAFDTVAGYLSDRYGMEREVLLESMTDTLAQQGRGQIFNEVCRQYALKEDIRHLVEVYRSTQPQLTLYEDAEELLQALEAEQIRTAVITDGCAQVQRAKINGLHLEQRMNVLMVTDEAGMTKPDPQVYARTLEDLGVKASDAVYVGDNPAKDFVGARALGMSTVRIIRPEGDHMSDAAKPGYEADLTVHALTELLQ